MRHSIIAAVAAVAFLAGCSSDTSGTTTTPADLSEPADLSDRELFRLAVELTFDGLPAQEAADLCEGVELFGMDMAVGMLENGFSETSDHTFHDDIARDVVADFCE